MKRGDIAILWNSESGITYRPLGEHITHNAICVLADQAEPGDSLLAVQPTLEEARVFGREFGKRIKERRSKAGDQRSEAGDQKSEGKSFENGGEIEN